jgi:hypothetical protein
MLPQLGREEVVHVAAGLRGPRHDRDLARQRAAPAQAVHLQQVGRADRADQRFVAGRLVLGQPLAQKERPARRAGSHQDAGDDVVHVFIFGDGTVQVNCIFTIN